MPLYLTIPPIFPLPLPLPLSLSPTDESQRGGAGNIGSPHIRPSTPGKAHDTEAIPDIVVRDSLEGDYHVGVRRHLFTLFS
jgi:hypothetical protein